MNRSLLWRFLQVPCRIATTLVLDLKVHGKHHVPADGGALLVANHQSYVDPVLVAVQLNRPVSFLAKSGLFKNKFFGWLITSLHAFPVKQGKGDVGAIKETIARLEEGHVLNIYPEGERTWDGHLGVIQAGIALVVRKTSVPIIPVAIIGAFNAWPRTVVAPRGAPVRILYGPALKIDGMKGAEIVRLLDHTLRDMMDQLYTMHPEVPRPVRSTP